MSSRDTARGIILVNKPRGMTSFGVVSRLRKLTGIRRIGHCGTLDPFADGLLPVCIGKATSAIQFMDGYDKTYLVKISFGRATDTMDVEGSTIDKHDFSSDELAKMAEADYPLLRQAVADLIGPQKQTPPMYSAVKLEGKPLYSYAREGKTVERKSRQITIHDAQLIEIASSIDDLSLSARLRISCSKGTYIRVIADELGRRLGLYAFAEELTREKCGPYHIKQAQDLEEMFSWSRELEDQSSFVELIRQQGILLPMDSAFAGMPGLILQRDEADRLIKGQPIFVDELVHEEEFNYGNDIIVLYYAGELIAAARIIADEYNRKQLKTERVFVDLEAFRSI